MEELDEWSSNANDVLSVVLMEPRESGLKVAATFHPKFTYPIVGNSETIYGYKDLKIQLCYRANDMRPCVKISYSKKLSSVAYGEVLDIPNALRSGEHLPLIAFAEESDFEESSEQMVDGYTPPGSLIRVFEAGDDTYEVWKGSFAKPAIRQMVKRTQIFVSFFIEAGSYIGDNVPSPQDDRWSVFFLYRKNSSGSYTFAGFSSIYRFFYFQPSDRQVRKLHESEDGVIAQNRDFDPALIPSRVRLSQFVILPPFQGQGNGPRLYRAIFDHYLEDASTFELTVEDPNEAFDDLRDLSDLTFLRGVPEFAALAIDPSVVIDKKALFPRNIVADFETLQAIRRKCKIAQKQFLRVLEMHLMSKLPDTVRPRIDVDGSSGTGSEADRHLFKLWQVLVKSRLYIQHRDLLSELEVEERVVKLDQTLRSVQFDFARLLSMHEGWARHQPEDAKNAKRKLVDTEMDVDEGTGKKFRVEEAEEAAQMEP